MGTSSDCSWLDDNLYCREFNNINKWNKSQSWFRGDSSSIVGQCSCYDTISLILVRYWYKTELECWVFDYLVFLFLIVFVVFPFGCLFILGCFYLALLCIDYISSVISVCWDRMF